MRARNVVPDLEVPGPPAGLDPGIDVSRPGTVAIGAADEWVIP